MDWSICNLTLRGSLICPGGNEYFIRNVYPPIQELQPRVLAVVIIFTLCLVVGICGNASVLTLIYGMIKEINPKNLTRIAHLPNSQRSTDNTILYIAALCVVDFLMSLSLPPAILDSIIGFWMFGTPICKLHHIFGSVGRIVSTFIITAMSFDRWVAVCHPYKRKFRSRKFVLYTIFALWIIAFLLLLPMLTYARANEILLHQLRQSDTLLKTINITRVRVYKCSDMLPPLVYFKYFFFGFSVLYAIWMSIFSGDGRTESTSELLLFIIYCVHLLPYLGSASNWILYGLLNTQLQRRQHEPSTSITTAIHTNNIIQPDDAKINNQSNNNNNLINYWTTNSNIPNGHSTIAKAMIGRKSKKQISLIDSKEDLLLDPNSRSTLLSNECNNNNNIRRKSASLNENTNKIIIHLNENNLLKNNNQSSLTSTTTSSPTSTIPSNEEEEEEGDQQL
ncbi:G_PROTEIN_RECEP_F1_2 domain-containing protein [Meloidogyne graminicola]|uniref:G_PROTEIN_RECEP_F1_2 domain-containing protein n=1 Tax=Meloidogyne graminicola TaxID=189291 RepID=A0A8S9ZX07_9BILA|nr:G_PROTEIN_RECEP_F1_2 domain-containing protein [Meloidogyne graminicola]